MVVVVAEFQYAKAMASMNTPAMANNQNNQTGARKVRRRRVSDGDSGADSGESFMRAG